MLKSICLLFVFCVNACLLSAQTTDLSITIEAQDLNGTTVSQVDIYEDFQYLITISNSGNAVNDATISIDFDDDLALISTNSQNNINGASDISNINVVANVLTASIDNMPNNSSVELLVLVTAPTNLGGIAANGNIIPPAGTTDTNSNNNQSIISIDVLDIVIDFSVTQTQIQPTLGTPINAWGDEVTYQFTITNNSAVDFPVSTIFGNIKLNTLPNNGQPITQFISLECIATTNGTLCPDLTDLTGTTVVVASQPTPVFIFETDTEITSGGSITFEMVYKYSNFSCSPDPMPIDVDSVIEIELEHDNASSNNSNTIITNLLNADPCPETDICIETVQTNPDISATLDYDQEITFNTTVCNTSSTPTPIRFFFQNITAGDVLWELESVNCTSTLGPVSCTDFDINASDNGQLWVSSDFVLQGNTTINIETILKFIEPQCVQNPVPIEAIARSAINILDSQIIDVNLDNNQFFNYLQLPAPDPENCDGPSLSGLEISKTQISPELPIGSSEGNTAEWGLVTYEITATNTADYDGILFLQDYMAILETNYAPITASLVSVDCVSTTGTASCFSIQNANIGVSYDGVPEDGESDVFWEILPEDNWVLPANSSVTFHVVVDWLPECSIDQPMAGSNVALAGYADGPENEVGSFIADDVTTFFAPCVDLVVQTYPEFTQVDTGQAFNWVVDISNSITSADAVDVLFENTLNSVFNIAGTPTCTVTSGNATCITNFNINGNFISGIIPSMAAGSTVRINIPVIAPNLGGAFNNIAEATPSAINNEELTPETNISINSVQVISPVLEKMFSPDSIFEGGESELIFTVYNIANNPTQNNISFTDNLPTGITITQAPNWVEANGCTANFIGDPGDDFIGVTDLIFPAGVESCTFSVMVTADVAGNYLNNFENFSDTNNIDASQTNAALNVLADTSNVDIEITKIVEPAEVIIGEEVVFTITATNLGTTNATDIEVLDQLPIGYEFISATTNLGVFDEGTFIWTISTLFPSESATLSLVARVVASNDLLNVALLNRVNEIDRDATNNEDSAFVEISNCLSIPEGISPNGDGKNDFLVIPCIEAYSNNIIKIYNRYGTQVYQANNYINNWNGRANMGVPNSSRLLPVGTYFYILEIMGFEKPLQGYVYLNY